MTFSAASARAPEPEASLATPQPPEPSTANDLASTDQMQQALSEIARRMRSSERRGPMRPGRLVSSRSRLRGEALWRAYRIGDGTVVLALAWLCCDLANHAGVWRTPVGSALPYFAGGLLLLAALRALDGYRFGAREGLVVHLGRIAGGFALAWLGSVTAAAIGLYPQDQGAAIVSCLALTSTALIALHLVWWSVTRAMRRSGRLTPNVVVVGATPNAARLIDKAIESREVAVLGIFDDRLDRAPRAIHGVPVLGDTDALMSHRIMPFVDRVVITVSPSAQNRVNALAAKLAALPNDVTLMVDVGADAGPSSALSRALDAPLARMSGFHQDDRRALNKRVQDLVVGCAALAVATPVMALIALAIRLDSPGPIFFRQRRHGFNNEDIVVWKFRSMHHAMRDEKASRQVSRGDDRVTRVGRFIRKTSLDELPQLLNVLSGEMSLVGPRPHAPGTKTGDVESARLVAQYAHRHRMKPGMTGWAAIKGSRGAMETPEQVRRRVALDVEYIERQSFWLDLYIMLMTLPCLLGDRQSAR